MKNNMNTPETTHATQLDILYANFINVANEYSGMVCTDKEFKNQQRKESIAYNKFMRLCDSLGLDHISEASKRNLNKVTL